MGTRRCALTLALALPLLGACGSASPSQPPRKSFFALPITVRELKRAFLSHGIQLQLSFPGGANEIFRGDTQSELGIVEVSIFHNKLTAIPFETADTAAQRKARKTVRVGNVIVYIRTSISPRARTRVIASIQALRRLA